MDFSALINNLQTKLNLKREDIESLVDKKYSEMRDLITKEGAVYLVAKEFGVSLPENTNSRMPIRSVKAGIRNASVIGRVFKISKTNEFTKSNGNPGRVANLFIGDNTGIVRVPLWDDHVKLLEEGMVSIGDVVQINNAFVKENIFGEPELSLGKFGSISHADGFIELPSVEQLSKTSLNTTERAPIDSIVAGGNFEIRGTIVQILKGNFLFQVCSMCDNKIEEGRCIEHGDVSPAYAQVISFIIDDGKGDLRCVSFRDVAEKLSGIKADELVGMQTDERQKAISDKILGKEMILTGRVKKNNLYDRLEMIVNDLKSINPLEESKVLLNGIELMVGN